METPTSEGSFDELFAHEEWVRRLALRLCNNSADDVAQDTWTEALRRRVETRSARAWLGGIVRHLSRRAHREASTRAERERDGAREMELPGPDALLARAELQRHVLAAVAALDEPYRVVVLMRYYEGLSSQDIALRLSLPRSTVRNRLSRAHERLRAKLDTEYGGDHAAWSALFLPGLASIAPHKVAAGVGITMKMATFTVAGTLAVGAFVLWRTSDRTGEPALEREIALDTSASTEPPIERAAALSPASSNSRSRAGNALDSNIEHVLLSGTIRGGESAELADATVSVWDEDGTAHGATVGKNATYSSFGLRPGRKELHVACRGFVPLAKELDLPVARARVQHDIELRRALVLPVKIVARGGGPLIKAPSEFRSDPAVVAISSQATRIANVLGRLPSENAVSAYRARDIAERDDSIPAGYTGVLEIRASLPLMVSCVLRDTVLESRIVRGNESELVFELDPKEVESKLGALAFTCLDASNGAVVANATVQLPFRDGGGSSEKTDGHGVARFERLAPGMRRIEIIAPQLARFERWIRIPPGETLDLATIELHPASAARGRVIDADGHGVAANLVAIPERALGWPRAVDPMMKGRSEADGSFKLSWTERGPLRLVAVHDDYALGALDVDASHASAEDLELRLEPGTQVTFRLPRGASAPIELVIADVGGRPLRLRSVSPSYAPRVRLKPGRYELRTIEDDAVVRSETFEVGTDPLVKEIQTP